MVCLIRSQTETYTGQDFCVLALVCGSGSKGGAGELKRCSSRLEKAQKCISMRSNCLVPSPPDHSLVMTGYLPVVF